MNYWLFGAIWFGLIVTFLVVLVRIKPKLSDKEQALEDAEQALYLLDLEENDYH